MTGEFLFYFSNIPVLCMIQVDYTLLIKPIFLLTGLRIYTGEYKARKEGITRAEGLDWNV